MRCETCGCPTARWLRVSTVAEQFDLDPKKVRRLIHSGELEAVRLLQLVGQLNGGLDPVEGQLPDGPTALFPGAAADPQSASWSGLRARVRRKHAAGARFLQTQMVMDSEALRRFCGEISEPLGLPVLAGVFLLKSARNAVFINRVVPGASIPQPIIDRLAASSDPAAEGVAIAAEQVRAYRGIAQGVHLMAVKAEERIPLILAEAGVSATPRNWQAERRPLPLADRC